MRREVGDQRSSLSRWEADYNLQPWTTLSLFDEYLEMGERHFRFFFLFVYWMIGIQVDPLHLTFLRDQSEARKQL